MQPLWLALAALLATLTTGATTWAVARRRTSGTVVTSDADQLWAESKIIRQELRAEAVELRAEATALRAEVASLRAEITACHAETTALRRRLNAIERQA